MLLNPEIATEIEKASSLYRVPAAIITSVAYHESRFNPRAVSRAGAKGIMQIMPSNFAHLGITDPFNPGQNIQGGTKMLSNLYKRYKDWPSALAAYVWGSGNVDKSTSPESWPVNVKQYVGKVLVRANMPVPFEVGESTGWIFIAIPITMLFLAWVLKRPSR